MLRPSRGRSRPMGGAGERSLLAADEGRETASATKRDEELDVDPESKDPDREDETSTGTVASVPSV